MINFLTNLNKSKEQEDILKKTKKTKSTKNKKKRKKEDILNKFLHKISDPKYYKLNVENLNIQNKNKVIITKKYFILFIANVSVRSLIKQTNKRTKAEVSNFKFINTHTVISTQKNILTN
jgi:hypothetical protein